MDFKSNPIKIHKNICFLNINLMFSVICDDKFHWKFKLKFQSIFSFLAVMNVGFFSLPPTLQLSQ